MGAGNYRADFSGTGGVFIVYTEHDTEEDYDNYVRNLKGSGFPDESSFEDYCQDDYDHKNMTMIECVENVAAELGMGSDVVARDYFAFTPKGGRRRDSALDDDFITVVSGPILAIGWRSWQDDLIVGVGASSLAGDYYYSPRDFAGDHSSSSLNAECLLYEGIPSSIFASKVAELSALVKEYLIMAMLQAGLDCGSSTSAWTSKSHKIICSPSEQIEQQKARRSRILEINAELDISKKSAAAAVELIEIPLDDEQFTASLASLKDDVRDALCDRYPHIAERHAEIEAANAAVVHP